MLASRQVDYPLFVKRDVDGFFGLFIDNLVQLLLIVALCQLCGINETSPLLLRYILPGAAVSIILGNLFYAWQAHRLARRENRSDVTELPYGINTPSLLVYVFFVMVPVYRTSGNPELAWQMGLIACLGSGLIELCGSFVAERIRSVTPRAALLSTLAGIAIGFISMSFALQIFHRPIVAMLPLAIILITYFSRVSFPLGLPGGLVAVVSGTLCAWVLPPLLPDSISGPPMSAAAVEQAWQARAFYRPVFAGSAIWAMLSHPAEWIAFLSVIVPMGLFNVVGSLQNIESAQAAGDRYRTHSALAVNGIGTIIAAFLGSCFPTTIYIGHPGWKSMGARAGYSTLNGLIIAFICLTGTVGFISHVVPMEAGIAIVLWIGIVITAQAFQATPKKHAPAVAMGLFPAIAAWGMTVTQGAFSAAAQGMTPATRSAFFAAGGNTMQSLLAADPPASLSAEVNGFLIHGMILLERGYIFTCMILAAISVFLIDRKFYSAALWAAIAALCAGSGMTHAYQLSDNIVDFLFFFSSPKLVDKGNGVVEEAFAFRTMGIGLGYLLFVGVFVIFGMHHQNTNDSDLPINE